MINLRKNTIFFLTTFLFKFSRVRLYHLPNWGKKFLENKMKKFLSKKKIEDQQQRTVRDLQTPEEDFSFTAFSTYVPIFSLSVANSQDPSCTWSIEQRQSLLNSIQETWVLSLALTHSFSRFVWKTPYLSTGDFFPWALLWSRSRIYDSRRKSSSLWNRSFSLSTQILLLI